MLFVCELVDSIQLLVELLDLEDLDVKEDIELTEELLDFDDELIFYYSIAGLMGGLEVGFLFL